LDMPAESNCFSICNGETYYFEPFNNKIFHFTNNELVPIFELNFGKYNIPDEFFKKSMMTGFGMINKKGFSLIKNVFENEQFLILQLTRQKEGDPVYLFNFIYNKKSEKLRYAAIGEEDYIFQLPIGITSENELMFLVFPIGDINRAAENFGLNINVSDIKEADNPMILFCKLEE
ncbi:MAG: 6-bladed beta-propeller, partial [Prolixibacteraceae bacterium]|nr:6-bladed beta-propeller [Prolixibacteraceae bacterium]